TEGFQQCYNAQLAVDGEFQIIVANRLTANSTDKGELCRVLDELDSTVDGVPECVLADAGYRKEADFLALESRQIDAYVALGRDRSKDASGQPLIRKPQDNPATVRMREKMTSPLGEERYRERKFISEAPNGWIKQVLGFRQFSVRGLNAAAGELNLVTMALNLRRMSRLLAV
ncbi:MAG: transposase, partial [Pseudomonadota bacterium]